MSSITHLEALKITADEIRDIYEHGYSMGEANNSSMALGIILGRLASLHKELDERYGGEMDAIGVGLDIPSNAFEDFCKNWKPEIKTNYGFENYRKSMTISGELVKRMPTKNRTYLNMIHKSLNDVGAIDWATFMSLFDCIDVYINPEKYIENISREDAEALRDMYRCGCAVRWDNNTVSEEPGIFALLVNDTRATRAVFRHFKSPYSLTWRQLLKWLLSFSSDAWRKFKIEGLGAKGKEVLSELRTKYNTYFIEEDL